MFAARPLAVDGEFLALVEQDLEWDDEPEFGETVSPLPVPTTHLPFPTTPVVRPEFLQPMTPALTLPVMPDAPTVEILADPGAPKGDCAFQLQMTAPDEKQPQAAPAVPLSRYASTSS